MIKKFFFTMLLIVTVNVQAEGFYLSSSDIQGQIANEQVYNSFGCTGKNISPQLQWRNAPAGTQSFAITVYDPDAPTGSGWWHWLVFNIDQSIDTIKTGASNQTMPVGSIESITSYGSSGFGGACPPEGDSAHRYIFTVYALDTEKIELGIDARPELVGFYINSHVLAKASIMAYHGR
ncbi:MAG: YbhB/YbcL family Raf kinase inhibitor-like protein [Gammaproteobacteria bacterium]|nr:MAG: YbhB/YbcL family Raf kinase inhibitor-like protein [Gammaproteobacteria bacterium]